MLSNDWKALPAKDYSVFLETVLPDGRLTTVKLTLEPQDLAGFTAFNVGLFWRALLMSLVNRKPLSHWFSELDSLRGGSQMELPLSWDTQ